VNGGVALAVLASGEGIVKTYSLRPNSSELCVAYHLPRRLRALSIDCGLSPDYYRLLRHGAEGVEEVRRERLRGFTNAGVGVFVALPETPGVRWVEPRQRIFGHGYMVRVHAAGGSFELRLVINAGAAEEARTQEELELVA
jgi:hypothetical protein